MQCTNNTYFAILWKAIKINFILDKGDTLLKSLGINQPLAVDELLHVVNIEGYNIQTDFLYNIMIYLSIK